LELSLEKSREAPDLIFRNFKQIFSNILTGKKNNREEKEIFLVDMGLILG